MSKNKDAETTSNILSIFNLAIGIVQVLISVGSFSIFLFTQNIVYVLLFVVILAFGIAALAYNRHIARNILYRLLNRSAPLLNFYVEKQSVFYECKSDTEFSFSNLYDVIATGTVTEIHGGKMKWTGGETPTPQAINPTHTIEEQLDPDGYKTRIIKFSHPCDKSREPIKTGFRIPKLECKAGMATNTLQQTVYNVTRNLTLTVLLSSDLKPKGNARVYEYSHSSDLYSHECDENYPVIHDEHTDRYEIVWQIKNPFYGGRYVIEWG